MRWAFKTRRSAGVRVSKRIFSLIKSGNIARDAGKVDEAIAHYRAVVSLAPDLAHIIVQIGHLLKDSGRFGEADKAYGDAAQIAGDPVDALLHRARLAERMGQPACAARYFVELLKRQPVHKEACETLGRLSGAGGAVSSVELQAMSDIVAREPRIRPAEPAPAGQDEHPDYPNARPLVFDLTDLVGHFRHHRVPNGIQRVQSEVLAGLLASRDAGSIRACCFVAGRDDWLEVPIRSCRELVDLAGVNDLDEPIWLEARARLFAHLTLAEPFIIPKRSILINLGTSIWVHDYFLHIRRAKSERAISYIPMVYDMIAIVRPEYCVAGWIREFTIWTVGLFHHADGYLAISESAKRDMIAVAGRLGIPLDEREIEVVPLDADFRAAAPPSATVLDRCGLRDVPFCLMVATIEPRKNHALAFDAWRELIRRRGAAAVPRLVCVGRDGWMNDGVFDRLDCDQVLAAQVTMLDQVSDTELAALYEVSLFTLFPSLYEGWGLPVTEALSHGRVPVVADNSSLPEAGSGLALMFKSGSLSALVEAIEQVAFDGTWRRAREAAIVSRFAPRSWAEVARQIEGAPARLLDQTATPVVAEARLGRYYPLKYYEGPALWAGLFSGEMFRSGDGWFWPAAGGCRLKAEGGDLRMRIPGERRKLRLYLGLRGLNSVDCLATVTVNGTIVTQKQVRRAKLCWLTCDTDPNEAGDLSIHITGALVEILPPTGAPASISVAGFFLCHEDDAVANAAFIAARRSDLTLLSAHHPPASIAE